MRESHLRVCSIVYDILILKANNFWPIIDFYTENGILNNVFEPSFFRKGSFTLFQNKDSEKNKFHILRFYPTFSMFIIWV